MSRTANDNSAVHSPIRDQLPGLSTRAATMLAEACAEYQRAEAANLRRVNAGLKKSYALSFSDFRHGGRELRIKSHPRSDADVNAIRPLRADDLSALVVGAPVPRVTTGAAALLKTLVRKLLASAEGSSEGAGDRIGSEVDC